MATLVKTVAYSHSDGREGRAVVLTAANVDKVDQWLGDKSEVTPVPKGHGLQLRIKTEKGIRVLKVGDKLVKFGKGEKSTYLVFKKS